MINNLLYQKKSPPISSEINRLKKPVIMKKTLLTILFLVASVFAGYSQIWLNPLTTGRPIANNYLGDKLSSPWYFNFEIGQASWNASEVGVGQDPGGVTGWNWATAAYYQDNGSNKDVRRDIGGFQFTATGTWYAVGRAKANSGDAWTYADEGTWSNETTLTASTSLKACPFFTVNALSNPSSCTASISGTTASLGWTKFTGTSTYNVMIVRYAKNATPTAPTNGTAYTLNQSIGTGTVVYATNTGSNTTNAVTAATDYDYYFYSENWSYYSAGQKITALAPTVPVITSFSASPNNGTSTTGYIGSTVTITGTNLAGATKVTIGGTDIATTGSTSTTATFIATSAVGTITVTATSGTSTASGTAYANAGYITNANTDWNTASTWLGGAVPAAAANVTIAGNITLNGAATNTTFTNVTINASSGITFGASGALTVSGALTNGGSVVMTSGGTLNMGASSTFTNNATFTYGTGTVAFANAGTVNGSAVTTFENLTINAGTLTLTTAPIIDGVFTINGGALSASPKYTSNSTLFYNVSYNRYLEWSATGIGTIGTTAGYPNNVTVNTGTLTVLNSDAGTAHAMAGNLTVNTGATFTTGALNAIVTVGGNLTTNGTGTVSMSSTSGNLNVVGNVSNAGTINLSTATGRLKTTNFTNTGTTTLSSNIGGDLELTGNLVDNNVFTANARAIFFTGAGTQTITGTGTFNIDYIVSNKSGGSIQMLCDLLCEGPNGGHALTLTNATDILDLNGHVLTLGKATVASDITGSGSIKGSAASSVSILGTGALGTINFTAGSQSLTNLTINRTSSGTLTLGTAVAVSGTFTITSGVVSLGSDSTAGYLTLGTLGTENTTWGSTNATGALRQNNTYFGSTGKLTVSNDTRTSSSVTVTGSSPFTYVYDRTAKTPTFTKTGSTAAITYLYSGTGISGTTSTTPINAGTYSVTASVAADANYSAASSSATSFTISSVALTVSGATTADKVYDGTTSASVTGGSLVGIISPDVVTLSQSGTFAQTGIGTGIAITSTSTLGGANAGNYTLTQPSLTSRNITAASSAVTVTGTAPFSYTYDGTAKSPSFTATGSAATITFLYSGTGISGTTATTPINVGTYSVTASVVANGNYAAASSSATGFAITKGASSISVNTPGSYTYNAASQGPTAVTKSGSTGSVTYSYVGVSGTSYTASATPPTNAGSYEVTATLAADTNYNGATSSAVGFTIGQLTPTVTVTPIGTYTYNGLAQGPTASNTGGSAGSVTYSYEGASYSASATRPTNAGSYTVTASVAATTNFAAASSDATSFTIDKAVVTVTGDDKTKTYGDSNPSFTASYDGFVHSETLATSGITGTPSLSTLADASSTVGTYTISTGAGDLAASNYSFSYKDGTLTVVTKGLAITAANQSKCFGSSLSLGTTAFTTSDMVSGDSVSSVSLSSTGTAVDASTGTYAITGSSASGTGLSNYAISYTDGTLTVNALPTATIGGNLTMCQNGTSPVVTFTGANGTAPYTFSYTINGGSTLTVSTTSGNSATVSVPTTTAGSFVYSLVSVQDSSTTACSQTQTGTATVTFNTSSIYYADADGDGYGNLKVTSAPLCAAPAGYVANSTDCDDTNAAINPGQSEVAGDGIDNNCDGRVDEAGVTTKVVASVCGTTLGSLNSPIYVNLVSSPVVGYRYEVSYGSPATVRVYDTTANNIILSNVVSPVYNTAYSIRVSVKTTQSNGDYWQAYGASCTVTTPAPPTTKLIPSLCGATLTSLYTNIYCGAVPLVTSYKFSVTDSNGVERVKITSTPVFNLMQFPSTPSYGVCSIKVAVLYNGVWQDYGTPCSLTTVVPTTQLVSTLCGTALTAIDFPLYATAVNQATAYQFEVSTGGSVVGSYTSSTNVFNLLQITGILYNTTYSVRVAPVCNGTTQAFGTSCSITTPTIVTTQLVASTCGTSLTSLYAPLYANAVPLATGYRFEVKNGATLVGTYDASSNVFNLMQVGVTSSTTYSVRVAVIYNGTAQGYGSTCTVTTPTLGVAKLLPALCGSTLTSLYAPLSCNAVTLATGYEFEVSDGVTTRTYDATSNQFNLMQLSGGAEYSTTYTVRVAPIISGVVQAFGASCTVTTLAIPTTTVVASRCGTTLTSLYAPIYANAVKLATGYAFKVIDNATGLQVGSTYSSSSNVFNLKQVSGTDKGKSYSISVAVQYNGLYQGFGTPCTVNTAANAAVRMSDETLASVFTVKAYPNPFANSFNLAIESESDEVISVQVYDMIGRELEARKATVSELSTQELGNNYPSGVYNIIVSQGDQVKTLRMIKR